MPTYEYECQKCGIHFDQFQSITAKPLLKCPTCKGKVKRLIGTGAGIIFKGSGFYATDYRSEGYKSAQKAEHTSNTSTAETKTESKPAERAAPASDTTKKKPAKTKEKA